MKCTTVSEANNGLIALIEKGKDKTLLGSIENMNYYVTKSQAEEVLEETFDQYIMPNEFETKFKFSKFEECPYTSIMKIAGNGMNCAERCGVEIESWEQDPTIMLKFRCIGSGCDILATSQVPRKCCCARFNPSVHACPNTLTLPVPHLHSSIHRLLLRLVSVGVMDRWVKLIQIPALPGYLQLTEIAKNFVTHMENHV